MLSRLEPLHSGRATEIDMIEREMEGGVVVIQPLDAHDTYAGGVGLIGVEADTDVRELKPIPPAEPKD